MRKRLSDSLILTGIIFLTGLIPPATASHIKCIINPQKMDEGSPLGLFISICLAEIFMPRYGEVSAPLTNEKRTELRKEKVTNLTIRTGAESDLLSEKTVFSHVNEIHLNDENNNLNHLKYVARYHPKALSISQTLPLSDDGVRCLKGLKIERLNLDCAVESSELLKECLSRSIKDLELKGPVCLPKFYGLDRLCLRETRIDAEFLRNLDSNIASRLDFDFSDLAPGSLSELNRFKKLRDLQLLNTNMDENDLQYVRPLKKLFFYSCTNPINYTKLRSESDAYLEKGEYKLALKNYQLTEFSMPSVDGYNKLSACYEKLGFPKLAEQCRKFAQSQ